MRMDYAVADHWEGGFDETGLQAWASGLRQRLGTRRVSLGLAFLSPAFSSQAAQVLELLRVYGQMPLLVGCSSPGLVAGNREWEENAGLVLGLYSLPGADLRACHFTQEQLDGLATPAGWHAHTGIAADSTNGWLAFADPFHLDCEAWLDSWNKAYPGKTVVGGLAGGNLEERTTQVYLNGEVYEEGGVAVSVGGEFRLISLISQGCTPIGDTWTITKTHQNFIQEIANRPAYEILVDTFNHLTDADRQKARGNLLVGLVVNEYLEEFHRGDFLIRNLLAADPRTGSLIVGALPRQGQTIQFQRRDAAAASEDLSFLLEQTRRNLAGQTIYGGCLCCCGGRGQHLFGRANHDAQQIQEKLGPLPLTGFFCNGEIGPVGDRNFLHGYTASLALFVKPTH